MDDSNQPPAGQLANLGEDNKPPKSRLSTAEAARSMLSGLIEADIPAAMDRTRIQKNIDGAPPFTRAELEKAGQGWRSNFNSGGARARIRDYLVAFHDIITSTQTLPNVEVTVGDIRQRSTWGQKISKRFHSLLFASYPDWSFIKEMHMHQRQLAIHGVGPCFRRKRKDWRFHALKRRNILVPRDSPADISRVPIVFIRDTMYVHELWEMVRGEKQSTNWNKPATFAAIKGAQKKADDKFNMEQAEEMWQNNMFDWGLNRSDVVEVAHAFVREFSKVSHHILTVSSPANYTPKEGETGYLYSDTGALDSIGECVWVCFQDIGNGDWESVRGSGLEAHQWGESQNRLNNGLFDNGLAAGAVMLQAQTPEAADKLTRIEIGPYRILPTSVEPVQINSGAGVNAQLAVSNHFSQQEASNTGSYRTRAATPSNQERTATEVEAEIGETSKLSNASVADYCIQADDLIAQAFLVATDPTLMPEDDGGPAALEMRRLLVEEDAIPEEMLAEICKTAKVTITRPIGNGSYADRVARLGRIGQFMGDMPDRKRKQFVRDSIAGIAGDRASAEAYGPDIEDDNNLGMEHSLAVLENNGFQGGGTQDPFSPDNAHAVHFATHYEFGVELLKGDPQAAEPVLEKLGPHMSAHLHSLEGDQTRQKEYKLYSQQFAEFMKMVDRNDQMADMAAQGQQDVQESPEMAAVRQDSAIKAQATQADIARKDAKAQQAMATKDATTAQNMRLKELQAAQDRALKQQQAADAANKPNK